MPGVADEATPGVSTRTKRFHLWSALLVAMSGSFVTALISLTGDLGTYWPLYLVPIVIAAFAYHVGGALIASALATALVTFLAPEAGATPDPTSGLFVGMAVFLLSGVVIGVQARRQRDHNAVLEQTSIRDQLTGLYKGDYLHNRLNEELRRSDRYATPVSLILVSVDDFLPFKERFGHYKADLMLEHMADLIRISVRETDIIGRYGPTEFAVVLPFSSAEQAITVGERIRQTVAEADFEGDVIDSAVKMTVSLGSATYPEEASTDDELVRRARTRSGAGVSEPTRPAPSGLGGLQEVPS